MFQAPSRYDVRVTADGSPIYWAEKVCDKLLAKFDPKKPTALFLGRYQPFHDGHRKLIEEGLRRVGQVSSPYATLMASTRRTCSISTPSRVRSVRAVGAPRTNSRGFPCSNITNVFYGRDVGYVVERLTLDEATESISATKICRELAGR